MDSENGFIIALTSLGLCVLRHSYFWFGPVSTFAESSEYLYVKVLRAWWQLNVNLLSIILLAV